MINAEYFLILLIIIVLSVPFAIIGHIVYWKKINYVYDTIAHATVLGIVFSIVFDLYAEIIVSLLSLLFVFIFYFLQKIRITKDSILIIYMQFSIAVSYLLISLYNLDEEIAHLFFGNIADLNVLNLYFIMVIAFLLGIFCYYNWDNILLDVLNQDIANVEGKKHSLSEIVFLILLSLLIVFGVKLMGALLLPTIILFPVLVLSYLTSSPFKSILLSSAMTILVASFTLCIIRFLHLDLSLLGAIMTIVYFFFLILKFFFVKKF